ncbi:UDP-N-acetylmuramoyl-L-alanine--D-glutamate ligase [Crassaminicella thermophila]|uniref:UDP-N-acetylmuramoylalanine--D-glutamate ligase n=1 Tax=Crassaminicella thermophila TaxID=2599308 RepID=A0A5C0SCL7_CRATE|nr:UDP-N-acetylmuramoyl-L-alanine--D-glutamate ligase [Crassaminicella thermophila]QEK11951.1 UDP-N-acetylmuramoyl-L-alanine--D-glutamate ligase [Crassaminicella thermophila]
MVIKDKRVLVIGLGISGIPTVNTLLSLGAKVTVNDKKTQEELKDILKELDTNKVDLILGKHPENMALFDLIILSPGVPTDLMFIQEARKMGVTIMGELELAYRLCEGKFVAITGTNGKTTTTALTGEIFKNAKKETYIVGNIGIAAISKIQEASADAIMVTEVSSFQLESIIDFKPKIAAILNITPDHLNRHKTMENYIKAKSNIFKNQDKNNYLVLNVDNEITYELRSLAKSIVIPFSRKQKLEKGAYVIDDYIVIKEENKKYEIICKVDELKIPGKHNLENALAAVAIAHWSGIDNKTIADTLRNFRGVEHRIEFVAEIEGVDFVNDSKGTNPDAAIRAIEAMKTPIVLIAGGMDKGSDFNEFLHSFQGKVKYLVLLGETAQKIKKTAQKNGFYEISIVENMEQAVQLAAKVAQVGDTVLLSPACASWDMYPSFEVRGKHFKECVNKLRG